MIVRVLTARVSGPNVGQFNHKLRAQLDELREQKGLVYAKLARRLTEDGGEEVVLFEEWRTPADLWEWTGGRLNRPRLLPGTEDLIDDLIITHYEALDLTPGDLELSVIEGSRPPAAGEPESSAEAPGPDDAEATTAGSPPAPTEGTGRAS